MFTETSYINVLITGGAGYLGSVIAEQLLNSGQINKLVIYDNLMYNQTSPIIHSHRKNFEFVYGDVRNHEQLLPYVEEVRCNYSSWIIVIVGFPIA